MRLKIRISTTWTSTICSFASTKRCGYAGTQMRTDLSTYGPSMAGGCAPPRRPMPAEGRQQAGRERSRCAALARRLDPGKVNSAVHRLTSEAGVRDGDAGG